MGEPLHMQVASHPATAAVTALCVGVWLWVLQRHVPPAAVGLSYHRFVADRQWWRALTAQVCHFDLLHLVLNVSSLWALAPQAEPAGRAGASTEYLRLSMLLLLASAAICLALHHVVVAVLAGERLRHTVVLGYSCVLFGWMTLIAWRSKGNGARFGMLGVASVPMAAAPFMLLLVTQVLLPNASFLGHLSGILAGLLLASGCLDWLTPYWTACLLFWVAIGVCYGLALEDRLGTPYIRLLPNGGGGDNVIGGFEAATAAHLVDLMERGGGGPSGAAAPAPSPAMPLPAGATETGGGSVAAAATAAAAVGAAAITTAARQMQAWVGAAWQRVPQGPNTTGGLGRASTSGAPTSTAAATLAARAAGPAGPALPWAHPEAATAAAAVAGSGSWFGRSSNSGTGGGLGGAGAGSGGGSGGGGSARVLAGWGQGA